MPTKILTNLAADDPLVQNANYRFDRADRQYVDEQIRGIETHLVQNLIKERLATYFRAGATLNPGDVVVGTSVASGELVVNLATTANITNNAVVGVVVLAAASGGYVLVAVGGVLPPSVTGLTSSGLGFATVTALGRLQFTSQPSPSDYVVGSINALGYILVSPQMNLPTATGATQAIVIQRPAISTASTSTTNIFSYTVPYANCVMEVDAIITWTLTPTSSGGGTLKREATYRRASSGSLTLIGSVGTGTDRQTAADTIAFGVIGGALFISVTPADASARNYSAEVRLQFQLP